MKKRRSNLRKFHAAMRALRLLGQELDALLILAKLDGERIQALLRTSEQRLNALEGRGN
jgi:hypothetical protein